MKVLDDILNDGGGLRREVDINNENKVVGISSEFLRHLKNVK